MPEEPDKPEEFTKEERKMWWDLVRDCTKPSRNDRPVMSAVVRRLGDLLKVIKGINFFLQFMCSLLIFLRIYV